MHPSCSGSISGDHLLQENQNSSQQPSQRALVLLCSLLLLLFSTNTGTGNVMSDRTCLRIKDSQGWYLCTTSGTHCHKVVGMLETACSNLLHTQKHGQIYGACKKKKQRYNQFLLQIQSFISFLSPEMAVRQLKPTKKRKTMRSGEMLFLGERGLVMSIWKNLRESGHF